MGSLPFDPHQDILYAPAAINNINLIFFNIRLRLQHQGFLGLQELRKKVASFRLQLSTEFFSCGECEYQASVNRPVFDKPCYLQHGCDIAFIIAGSPPKNLAFFCRRFERLMRPFTAHIHGVQMSIEEKRF